MLFRSQKYHLITDSTLQVEKVEEKGNLLQRAVQLLSDIFVPIIPAIVAGVLLLRHIPN